MRVSVDRARCEGNAICSALAPEVFDLDDDDVAVVLNTEPGAELTDSAHRAADACPRTAILVAQ